MARIVRQMPSWEEINGSCADAIRVYKRFERQRILLLAGWMVALTAALIALVTHH